MAEGSRDAACALLHIKGVRPVTKLVEGPLPRARIYDQGLQAQGSRKSGFEGLPRFSRSSFKGQYPFAEVDLSDPEVPLRVKISGWNPFIPLDDKNSGIPCAILEYTLSNPTGKKVDYDLSYHLSHLAQGSAGHGAGSHNAMIPGKGIFFYNTDKPTSDNCGSASLTVIGHKPVIKTMWFRGGWFDAFSVLWREISTGCFKPNTGSGRQKLDGRTTASPAFRKPGPGPHHHLSHCDHRLSR